MKKYDVSCSRCCGTYLETNDKFDANGVTGDMFEVKEEFDLEYIPLRCPSCGWRICGENGRVRRIKVVGDILPAKNVAFSVNRRYPNFTRTVGRKYTSKDLASIVGCSESSIRAKRKLIEDWATKEGRGYLYTYEAIDFLRNQAGNRK